MTTYSDLLEMQRRAMREADMRAAMEAAAMAAATDERLAETWQSKTGGFGFDSEAAKDKQAYLDAQRGALMDLACGMAGVKRFEKVTIEGPGPVTVDVPLKKGDTFKFYGMDIDKPKQEHKSDATTERTRILSWLDSMEPSREPYSRPSSEFERKATRRLWERLREAIEGGKDAPKGEK